MFDWFKKEKPKSVRLLREFNIDPEIRISKEEHDRLYNEAVRKVEKARLSQLMLADMGKMVIGEDRIRQTQDAINEYGSWLTEKEAKKCKEKYPLVRVSYHGNMHGSHHSIDIPKPTLEQFAEALADRYLADLDKIEFTKEGE